MGLPEYKGLKKRNAVFGIDDYINFSTEFKNVVKNRPKIDGVKTTASDDIDSVDCFTSYAFAIVAAKDSYHMSLFDKPFGDFMNVDFGST